MIHSAWSLIFRLRRGECDDKESQRILKVHAPDGDQTDAAADPEMDADNSDSDSEVGEEG